jgi:hypothetical protein
MIIMTAAYTVQPIAQPLVSWVTVPPIAQLRFLDGGEYM